MLSLVILSFRQDISQYDVNLLMKAKEASSTAPASLAGVRVHERETSDGKWVEEATKELTSKGSAKTPSEEPAKTVFSAPTTLPHDVSSDTIFEESTDEEDGKDGEDVESARSPMHTTILLPSPPNEPVQSSAVSIKSRKSSRARGGSVSSIAGLFVPPPAKPSVSSQSLSSSDANILPPRPSLPSRMSSDVEAGREGSAVESSTQVSSVTLRNTVTSLLNQLTEMHDRQQVAQKAEWDVFLAHRRARRRSAPAMPSTTLPLNSTSSTLTSGGRTAAALLGLTQSHTTSEEEHEELSHQKGLVGLATMGIAPFSSSATPASKSKASGNKNNKLFREDWREFARLVRKGVPLVYRAKIWSECVGALDMNEPGYFTDLLSSHKGEESSILGEIEKDVKRTSESLLLGFLEVVNLMHLMETVPTNIFFGGDGVGVDKLRRVLHAYSW